MAEPYHPNNFHDAMGDLDRDWLELPNRIAHSNAGLLLVPCAVDPTIELTSAVQIGIFAHTTVAT